MSLVEGDTIAVVLTVNEVHAICDAAYLLLQQIHGGSEMEKTLDDVREKLFLAMIDLDHKSDPRVFGRVL